MHGSLRRDRLLNGYDRAYEDLTYYSRIDEARVRLLVKQHDQRHTPLDHDAVQVLPSSTS
jgi:hypothetical protein